MIQLQILSFEIFASKVFKIPTSNSLVFATFSNSSDHPSNELSFNDNSHYIVRNRDATAASSLAIDAGSNNNNIQEVTTGFDQHGTLILSQCIISKKLGPNNFE